MGTCRKQDVAKGDAILKPVKHATVHIAHGGLDADVDCGIAPLVMEAWKAGIVTRQCCEADRDGQVWIQFATVTDLTTFLDIAAGNDSELGSLYDRVLYGYDRLANPVPAQWRYEVAVHDFAVEEVEVEDEVWEEIRFGPPEFEVFVSVRFPRRDINAVLRRLKNHNRTFRGRLPSP